MLTACTVSDGWDDVAEAAGPLGVALAAARR
jgi:MYXO-CTERM domain-containing protein